jgi:hypothetical protein
MLINSTIKSLPKILSVGLLILAIACTDRNKRLSESNQEEVKNHGETVVEDIKISKAVFFIENSESMFGYVNGFTEYVDVVSELAEKPMFAEERTQREFYFINGGDDLQIMSIGNNPAILKNVLNTTGFQSGDITKSNLNSMFQKALEKARGDTISILISDAIYDIGRPQAPMNALSTEGRETRSRFIERLSEGDLQTIMVKLYSHFDGYYFPVTGGKIKINQTRPFYIWIFGKTELLNKYFPESYINSLKGYANMIRFLKFDELDIPFQATALNRQGDFRFDKQDGNKLIDVESDRNDQGFQFSFATDFSSLPYSDSSFETVDNYECNENYTVKSVKRVEKKIYEVTSFAPTHLITVYTQKSPYCELNISLKNVVPIWINNTNSDDESYIENDTTQTFGFKFLTNAMSEAYSYKNKEKNITNFSFEITK